MRCSGLRRAARRAAARPNRDVNLDPNPASADRVNGLCFQGADGQAQLVSHPYKRHRIRSRPPWSRFGRRSLRC